MTFCQTSRQLTFLGQSLKMTHCFVRTVRTANFKTAGTKRLNHQVILVSFLRYLRITGYVSYSLSSRKYCHRRTHGDVSFFFRIRKSSSLFSIPPWFFLSAPAHPLLGVSGLARRASTYSWLGAYPTQCLHANLPRQLLLPTTSPTLRYTISTRCRRR